MLNDTLKTQLKAYLEKMLLPIEIVASTDDSAPAGEMMALLRDIAALSPLVTLVER
ncbi:MAG TPA: alkyl hydroperoxide reductase subunit F, partial [Quisquiliibacterium sp.]|nr:alkyl hydroperoxide reductase subunit F [Quisquiliibacterium sp.]